jgi:hypothetical protein
MKSVFLIFILLAFNLWSPLLAQESARHFGKEPPVKHIEVVGNAIPVSDAFFIGEVHALWEGLPFEFEMVRWLYKNYGIRDIAMEWGKSEAYQFNAYLRNGDTAILSYYGRSKRIMEQLAKFRALYTECGITFHGIDFERSTYVTAGISLLERNDSATASHLHAYLSELNKIIDQMDDSRAGKRNNIKKFSKAQRIFRSEKSMLQRSLGASYTDLADIFDNPALERQFKKRDAAMAANLAQLRHNGAGFLCITGLGHTTLHKKTMLKRYLDNNPAAKVTLVNMMCKNCYTSSYFKSSVIPMIADYEDRNLAYMEANFEKFYHPDTYTLLNQHQFTDLPGGYNAIPTYYVLFKDQPRW